MRVGQLLVISQARIWSSPANLPLKDELRIASGCDTGHELGSESTKRYRRRNSRLLTGESGLGKRLSVPIYSRE